MSITLKIRQDTIAKLSPEQSTALSDKEKVQVAADTVFQVHSHDIAENKHVKVALKNATLGPEGRNTWYFFAGHVDLEGNYLDNEPKDEPNRNRPGNSIRLPNGDRVNLNDPIIRGGNFTWGEATHQGTRIPVDMTVVQGFIRAADAMQDIRQFLGDRPIDINSWYRDPETNRRVGGASRSQHMVGDGVDFVVRGLHPQEVFRRLNPWWGDRGGLASTVSAAFTHIDTRGYRARWTYPF